MIRQVPLSIAGLITAKTGLGLPARLRGIPQTARLTGFKRSGKLTLT